MREWRVRRRKKGRVKTHLDELITDDHRVIEEFKNSNGGYNLLAYRSEGSFVILYKL